MQKLTRFPSDELQLDGQIVVTISENLAENAPYSEKDQIKLNNLISTAKDEIKDRYPDLVDQFDKQFDEVLQNQRELLTSTLGLVLLIGQEDIYYYHVGISTPDTVVVGDSPFYKPLIKYFQYSNEFHVLVLNQDGARIFHVDFAQVDEVSDPDNPMTVEELLGTEREGGELAHGTYGSRRGEAGPSSFHGHNETSAMKEIDRDNIFREIDNFVYDSYSRIEEIPLVLYALPENQAAFRNISKNQFLHPLGIEESGARIDMNQLKEKAHEIGQQIVAAEQTELKERFEETTPEFRVGHQLDDLASNSIQGRIEELVLSDDVDLKGTITPEGYYEESDEDFIKQLVKNILTTGGKVYVLAPEHMPLDPDLNKPVQVTARLRY